jgi:hypothetical protein
LNSVHQEVMLELSDHHKDCVEQLLDLWVSCLTILQDLADKVHRLLLDFRRGFGSFNDNNGADNCIGGYNVQ